MADNFLRIEDLVTNPTARVPICLCLDVSGSMGGPPIEELNAGVQMFYGAIMEDEVAQYSAEICIVIFGGDDAKCLTDFASMSMQPTPPTLFANGGTPMGEAVTLALDKLEARKTQYKSKGVDYYQPWLVLMTDGKPNGSSALLEESIARTNALIAQKKLTIFPIGIGNHADMRVLARYSPQRPPLKLQGLKFRQFFSWLSQSVAKTSQSLPGERIALDMEGLKGWAEL